MKDLQSLLFPSSGNTKHIYFSGKGGVGKTSLACITAVYTARKGYKTLLVTTDPAAHIANVLDAPVESDVTPITSVSNLSAAKIDPKKATEDYKDAVLSDARSKFDPNTIQAMEEELNSPCTEEMAVFQKFIDYAGRSDFDVLVFDTAPTGHTLRLLELPMDWSSQIQLKAGVTNELTEADQREKEKFDTVIRQMKDPETTTFAFVMYPEKTPMVEAFRASEELETVGITTQLVVANLIIPEEHAVTPFFQKRRKMQETYLGEIAELFSKAALLQVPMFETEIKGIAMIDQIVTQIFD